MEEYTLKTDEAVLYKGTAWRRPKNSDYVEVMLTNVCLVLTKRVKKLFAKEQVTIDTFPVETIKLYNDVPQVKQKNSVVEVFFQTEEIELSFGGIREAYTFTEAINKLLTGKGALERGAAKVKGVVNMVDDTLGINSVGAVSNMLTRGVTGAVFGGAGKAVGKVTGSTGLVKDVLGVAKMVMGKNNVEGNQNELPAATVSDDQIEALKKLKELLDAGILSQEEFDAKKKAILGL